MENREMINLILDFGTFLTAIVSLLTLWEMRKQRLTSIQPDIALQNFNYLHLYYLPKLNMFASWPYFWSIAYLDALDNLPQKKTNCAFEICFENVGANTAKEITYQWEYNIEQYITALAQLDIDTSIFYETGADGRITVENSHSISFLPNINNPSQITNYLSVGDRCYVPFCESYTQFVSLWLLGKFNWLFEGKSTRSEEWKRIIDEFNTLSPLSLKISFSDLQGNEYTKKYTFSLSVAVIESTSIDFSVDIVLE